MSKYVKKCQNMSKNVKKCQNSSVLSRIFRKFDKKSQNVTVPESLLYDFLFFTKKRKFWGKIEHVLRIIVDQI